MARKSADTSGINRLDEINIDGLVGPTHNYSGLSSGNVASTKNKANLSNPRAAALQGLAKMKALMDLGIPQAVCPPNERPDLEYLRTLGFQGNDAKVVADALSTTPTLFANGVSASSMWMANAATMAPSADTEDGKVHFTPANLTNKLHRSLESRFMARFLKKAFRSEKYFVHHAPLPAHSSLGDEGAANHTRLWSSSEKPGVHFFVFGKKSFESGPEPKRFPARQTYEASRAVSRLHRLNEDRVVFAQQSPDAIDAGVFHNDVVAVGHEGILFYHEKALLNSAKAIEELRRKFEDTTGGNLTAIEVAEKRVSLADAVGSYLFNTQIVTRPTGERVLIAPRECEETESVRRLLGEISGQAGAALQEVRYFDLRQSMQNGGGPACLRLRVVLTPEERRAAHAGIFLTPELHKKLTKWVEKHYRDRLSLDDFADPKLHREIRSALDQLTTLLDLGSLYPFQSSH